MQLVLWLILNLQSSQSISVSAASHNTFMMSWTGSEYKTRTLWVILLCHTLLWETADVYCNSLAVWLAAEYSLLTLQIQKRTFLRSYHIWQLNNTQVRLWHTPRIHLSQSEAALVCVKPLSCGGGGPLGLLLGYVPDDFYTVKPIKSRLTVLSQLIGWDTPGEPARRLFLLAKGAISHLPEF